VGESEMLYDLLEQEIVPAFYDRGRDGLPRAWAARMKTAIRTLNPVFNTHRMVQEYTDRFYIPASLRHIALDSDGRLRSRELAEWKRRVKQSWEGVHFVKVESGPTENLLFGTQLEVTADVHLAGLSTDDVTVEIYYGDVDPYGRIPAGKHAAMTFVESLDGNVLRFRGNVPCNKTGQQGFSVWVIPSHGDLGHKHETALVTWA
jgi:glycogen phosphorylase